MTHISSPWPEWELEDELGSGSFGRVFSAVRRDYTVSHSAIKVISIPSDTDETSALRAEGLDEEQTRSYYRDYIDKIIGEIRLMQEVKGKSNIVGIEDYRVVEREDPLGWDIYIRMELLTPLRTWIDGRTVTEEDVVRLGTQLCGALEVCRKRNILHRDIKPENIFVDSDGDFKLGDFGISRTIGDLEQDLTRTGTPNYTAPEVFNNQSYDQRADLYSLGLVLYWLLNNRRLPFLDPDKKLLLPAERQEALRKRMRGEEPLPRPRDASDAAAEVILKACAFRPEDRYASPAEMEIALRSTLEAPQTAPNTPARKRFPIILGAAMLVLLAAGAFYGKFRLLPEHDTAQAPKPSVEEIREESEPKSTEEQYLEEILPEDDGTGNESDDYKLGIEAFYREDYETALTYLQRAASQDNAAATYGIGYVYDKGYNNPKVAYTWYEKAFNMGYTGAAVQIGKLYNDGRGVSQSYEEAYNWYMKGAAAGSSAAMNNIGYLFYEGNYGGQDYAQAMTWFEKAYNAGDARAANNIGTIYECGYGGVPVSYSTAMLWYQKAAEMNDAMGFYNMGRMYALTREYVQAREYYQKAAELKYANAMCALGNLCREGLGGEQSIDEAAAWYQRAADLENAEAMAALGDLYRDGRATGTKEPALALSWYLLAAEHGDTSNYLQIGNLYYEGDSGVDRDYAQALEWYLKAAEQGNTTVYTRIGYIYYEGGRGVDRDYAQALEWYLKAAEAGSANAMFTIGNLYYRGEVNGQPDYAQALEWYRKAAEAGSANAMFAMGHIYYRGEVSGQPEYAQALEWYLKAAEAGSANAMFTIGNLYYRGEVNGQPDYAQALEWYLKGAEKDQYKNGDFTNHIGYMYENGLGTDHPDLEEALRWYERAAEGGSSKAADSVKRLKS